jgi:hypothetical protein
MQVFLIGGKMIEGAGDMSSKGGIGEQGLH